MTEIAEADRILSDPNFDVESFVKFINVFYETPKIVNRLSSSIDIFVGLIKAGEYQFLLSRPDLIDVDIFKKLHEAGYETWHKKKGAYGGIWWGVILDDDLSIHYRHYQRSPDFEVYELPAETIRKRWANKDMSPYGTTAPPKHRLSVYDARSKIHNFAMQKLKLNGNGYFSDKRSYFHWDFWDSNVSYYLRFYVVQNGKDHIRIRVTSSTKDDILYNDKKSNQYNEWRTSAKFAVDDPNLALKVFTWVAKARTQHVKFFNYKQTIKINKSNPNRGYQYRIPRWSNKSGFEMLKALKEEAGINDTQEKT